MNQKIYLKLCWESFLINTGTTQVLFLNYSFLIKYTGKLQA